MSKINRQEIRSGLSMVFSHLGGTGGTPLILKAVKVNTKKDFEQLVDLPGDCEGVLIRSSVYVFCRLGFEQHCLPEDVRPIAQYHDRR